MMADILSLHLVLQTLLLAAVAQLVYVPSDYTYNLPRGFNNTFTGPFVDTDTTNSTAASVFAAARNASFVSFSDEFSKLVGTNAKVRIVASSTEPFAFEGGIWVPTLNQIWFTAFLNPVPGYVSIFDLDTSTIFRPNLTGPAADTPINPNGGYYFDGLVYLTSFGNETLSPAIVAVDPLTYETREVVNSYFGLPLNGPDDVTIAKSRRTGQACLFYSDFFFAAEGLSGSWPGPQQLPNAVYRLSVADNSLQMVISSLDIQTPNGLAVDRHNKLLYVSDGPDSAVFGQPYGRSSSSPGLYVFDLRGPDGCTPQNKRLLDIARQGFPNGIKIDDHGRIWDSEYEGVIVRSPTGKVLGIFNIYAIAAGFESPDVATGANFALVEDQLFILGFNKIYAVRLAEVVKSWY